MATLVEGTFAPAKFWELSFQNLKDMEKWVKTQPIVWRGKDWQDNEVLVGERKVSYSDSWKYIESGCATFDKEWEATRAIKARVLREFFMPKVRTHISRSIVGSAPCVGAAITGHPRAMYRRVSEPRREREVEIFFDLACPWYTPVDFRAECGVSALAACEILRARGYKVKLSLGATSACEREDMFYSVRYCAQDFGQRIAAKKLLFQMCAKSSLFHIYADALSRIPETKRLSGLGACAWNTKAFLEPWLGWCTSERVAWISVSQMTDIFGNVDDREERMKKLIAHICSVGEAIANSLKA